MDGDERIEHKHGEMGHDILAFDFADKLHHEMREWRDGQCLLQKSPHHVRQRDIDGQLDRNTDGNAVGRLGQHGTFVYDGWKFIMARADNDNT